MLINFSMRPPQDGRPDERYAVRPPKGVCKNKLCPEPPGRRDDLVRGYCKPCASIRKPAGRDPDYQVDYTRVAWGSIPGIVKYRDI